MLNGNSREAIYDAVVQIGCITALEDMEASSVKLGVVLQFLNATGLGGIRRFSGITGLPDRKWPGRLCPDRLSLP